jgi:hypothetical protein
VPIARQLDAVKAASVAISSSGFAVVRIWSNRRSSD